MNDRQRAQATLATPVPTVADSKLLLARDAASSPDYHGNSAVFDWGVHYVVPATRYPTRYMMTRLNFINSSRRRQCRAVDGSER